MTRHRHTVAPLFLILVAAPLFTQSDHREHPRLMRLQQEERREGHEAHRGRPPEARTEARPEARETPPHRVERTERERPERTQRQERESRPSRALTDYGPRGRAVEMERRDREAPSRTPTPAPPRRSENEARAWQARGAWHRDAWTAHATWREHRARRWEADHRTWSQRGGYGGYVIPTATYQNTFGVRNSFRIGACPAIYQGYPRFTYAGYWFFIVDPWPEYWVDDWYDGDDVYIAYDVDGYYLFNLRRPGARLALMVSL